MTGIYIHNKLQWILNQYIFIQENQFENGVCSMASILIEMDLYHAWSFVVRLHDILLTI